MNVVGAGFRRVLDESAAGMTVLRRVSRGNDLHYLNRIQWWRTLVALLMARCISECSTIEKVLGCHGLAAVNTRIELAAAEHRVAIWLHGQVAGLDLQHRLRKADVCSSDYRQVRIVLIVHCVADVRRCGIDSLRARRHLD